MTDNELLLMESIHLFVEILDQDFSNVCEVRLPNSRLSCEWFDFGWFVVFHFNKVYMCLDEFILTGEILESSEYTPLPLKKISSHLYNIFVVKVLVRWQQVVKINEKSSCVLSHSFNHERSTMTWNVRACKNRLGISPRLPRG